MPSPHTKARLALLSATLVWGATFVVVQRALDDLPVLHLLALRFALGAGLLLPLLLRRRRRSSPAALLRDGLGVGVALFAGYALQTYGLLWTTPSRSAFLTGLTVLLVPALGRLAGVLRLRWTSLAGAACAAAGLWVLFRPWSGGGAAFNLGDALTLGCAAAFAVQVLLVERAVRRHSVAALAVVQFLVVAALSAPSLVVRPLTRAELTPAALAAVAVTGIFATALAFVCQLYAQRRLGAVETAVILSMEPPVAAAVSLLIGREAASAGLLLGGGLIVAGMLLSDLGAPAPAPPGAPAPRS